VRTGATCSARVNGAAARLVSEGDKVIICSYAGYGREELESYLPVVVHVDDENHSIGVDSDPGILLSAIEGGIA
jgi:aspartate 1-decarboxylase